MLSNISSLDTRLYIGSTAYRPAISPTLTKPVIEKLVDEILLVDEDHIERAISVLVEQQRLVAEGAGAAGIASILQYSNKFKGNSLAFSWNAPSPPGLR